MKLDKLAKKLKKEITRNWQKSAALGACCVVALWFWAPLVAKWMGHGSTPPAAAPAANTTAEAPAATVPTGVVATAKTAGLRWNEIVELMQRDTRAATATVDFKRDPFARVLPPPAAPEDDTNEHAAAEAVVAEVTPESAGLVLTGTMLSQSGGVATLSGHAYRIGESIVPHGKGETGNENPETSKTKKRKLEFTLLEVHSDRVVLARGEKHYELAMKESQLAGGNQIFVRTGNTESK